MNQILSIQALRAFAALAVVYGHAAHDAAQIAARNGLVFEGPMREASAAGVDLFFVISGFVMVWSSRNLFGAPGAARLFLTRRLARIVPIYWLTTGLFLLALAILPGSVASAAPTALEIIQSLLFFPYIRTDDGIMQPVFRLGWTLNYEMFFYVCFAALLALPVRRAVFLLAALFSAAAVYGVLGQPGWPPLIFWTNPIILEFVLGAGIGYAYLSGFRAPFLAGAAVSLAGFAVFLALNGSHLPVSWVARFYQVGIPAGLIVGGLALAELSPTAPKGWLWPLVAAGDASYALYLIHPMVVRALSVVWTGIGAGAGGLNAWLFIATALAASTLVAMLIYRYFERPFTKYLQKRLSPQR